MSFEPACKHVTVEMVLTINIDSQCLRNRWGDKNSCNRHSCHVLLNNGEGRKFSMHRQEIQDFLDVIPHEIFPAWHSHFQDNRANWLVVNKDGQDAKGFKIIHKDHDNITNRINELLTKKFNSDPDETDLEDLETIARESRRAIYLE